MAAIVGTSFGYIGTEENPSIDTIEWAKYQGAFGNEYFVDSDAAARVTHVSGTTFRIGAGATPSNPHIIGGHGVVDVLTGSVDLTLGVPGTDGTVHHMIGARRTWQATNATTFESVAGNANPVIPAGRNKSPGTIDDHPLGLVSITKAGSTITAGVVADLRAIGHGHGYFLAHHDLVRQYMDKPGYRIRIGTAEWIRLAGGDWYRSDNPDVVANSTIVQTNGSGQASVPYGVTFASPPIFNPTIGDDASGPGLAGAVVTVRDPDPSSRSTTRCVVQVRGASGTPVANVTVRIDWIAVGRLA